MTSIKSAEQKPPPRRRVWLFDLDNTLHNASHFVLPALNASMTDYIVRELQVSPDEANRLRRHYWLRYGATLLGLMRHHGVRAAHFLHQTHLLPGLERELRGHRADFAALKRLPGRKLILTNAPLAYAERVLRTLGISRLFDDVVAIDHMHMFGHLRPKPDARMLRALAARLRVAPSCCVLVEDTLAHQKAARRVGMQTVWMQRWLKPGAPGVANPVRRSMWPAYVDRKLSRLRALAR